MQIASTRADLCTQEHAVLAIASLRQGKLATIAVPRTFVVSKTAQVVVPVGKARVGPEAALRVVAKRVKIVRANQIAWYVRPRTQVQSTKPVGLQGSAGTRQA